MKYRITCVEGRYYVQERHLLFFWVNNAALSDVVATCLSDNAARRAVAATIPVFHDDTYFFQTEPV